MFKESEEKNKGGGNEGKNWNVERNVREEKRRREEETRKCTPMKCFQ